jgi:phosphoribosylanthranilate isomerase
MARIKICGITNQKDALSAVALGVWALGFIFYKKSPRYVQPKSARKIIESLPKNILAVGVFVNQSYDEIVKIAEYCCLKAIQFHGDETPLFCKKFKGYQTIKAFRLKDRSELLAISRYKTDYCLLDTFKQGVFGGTGKTFDWQWLKDFKVPAKKIILSGGLNAGNIKHAVQTISAYAFDVSSGVEKRPGKKCKRLMKEFFNEINNRQ